jgi:TetR/AcrR family transcriptional regulator, transcriptional repressor of bet genes
MEPARQAFTRGQPDDRRQSLIAACGRCLAAHGVSGTTVRAICAEAGVSPGLLRHYFSGVDALIAETYRTTGARVADALNAAVDAVGDDPRDRLLAYVTASFRPPIADPALLSTWLAFWGLVKTDQQIAAIHAEVYSNNRRDIEDLIRACPGGPHDARLASIGLTALVDGLWLELSLGTAPFSSAEANALAARWLDTLVASAD